MELSFDDIIASPTPPAQPQVQQNQKKFLDFIAESEGADYNTIVGGKTFEDFSKHPGVVGVTTKEGPSTAAGRYQIVGKTYEPYAKKLGVSDFTPETQDKIALELIKDKGALEDVNAGNFEAAIDKLGGVWASFPSSPYSQPKRSKEWVKSKLASGEPEITFDDILAAAPKQEELSFDDIVGTPKEKAKEEPTFLGTLKESLPSFGGDKVSDKSLSDLIAPKVPKPTEISFDDIVGTPEKQNPLATFGTHTLAGVIPAMGGFGAAEALTAVTEPLAVGLAPVTGGQSLWVVPLLSTLGGYGVGSYYTHKAERNLLPENVNTYLDEGARQNEYSAFFGDLGAFGAVGGIGKPDTLKKAVVLAGGGLGFEGFNQWMEDKLDVGKLAIATLTMPFLGNKPTVLGDIATLKSLRQRKPKEAAEDVVKDFENKGIYVPLKVGDVDVVNVSKETPTDYSTRHGVDQSTIDTHKETRTSMEGPVRTHVDANGKKTIEVDPTAIETDFADKAWTKHYDLPADQFKSPQAYTDYLLARHQVQDEMPFSVWKENNPSVDTREAYDSRKSYYDELDNLESMKLIGEFDAAAEARFNELKAQGAPKPVIKDPANLNALELKSVLYGAKNVGEALDRLAAGKFGGREAQELIKTLQKNKFISDAALYISEREHPQKVPGEYAHGPNTHELTLYPGATPRVFMHEVVHAGTSKALNDPINAELKTKFENFLADLQKTAAEQDLWDPNTKQGHYGLTDIYEMLSEAFTNREFQGWLKDRSIIMDNKPTTGWEGFKAIVKDLLGIKDQKGISAFDQVIDLANELTRQENKYGRWDREPTSADFESLKHPNEEYNNYVNTAALEIAEANPLYNVDNLNVPPIPTNANELGDFLYTLEKGRTVDEIRSDVIYKTLDITPEQKDTLRLFVEGLHKDHITLNSQALELDNQARNIQRSIRESYSQWEQANPGKEPSSEFKRGIAQKYKQIEDFKKSAEDLRERARQRVELSPEDKKIYDEIYEPLLKARKEGLQYLMNEGIIPKVSLEGDNFPRKLAPMNEEQQLALDEVLRARGLLEPEPSLLGRFKNTLGELAGGDMGGFNVDLQRRRASTQERSLFVLERESGRRDVIQVTKSGNIIKWDNINGVKTPTLLTRKISPTDGSKVTQTGQVKIGDEILGGKVIDGTMQEIEAASPYVYNKDSLAVLLNSVSEIRDQVRNYEGLKQLTESPLFKEMAIPPGVDIPEGFRVPMFIDKIPTLRGYAFPVKTAEVIEDFARTREPALLTNLSGIIVKNMMMNPLPHMFNEAMHVYNARGLTGWVTPPGIYRFVKYGKQAIDDVLGQSKFYTDTIKLGGALLAPGTRYSPVEDALIRKGIDEFSKTPEFKGLAGALGRSFKEMYNGLSKTANRAMWISRDIMYMQYLRELMATRDMSHAEAIKYGELHLPNYRLPTRVGEKVLGAKLSRGLSSVLQNPNVTVFSRYHYGYLRSMIETVKEAGALRKGKEGTKEFLHGMDSIAAIAVALAVLYPMVDMVAQNLTGNPDAKQRRAGPYHFINAVHEVAEGSKEPRAIIDSMFTFNPALTGLYQLAYDKNLYTNQEIYSPYSEPSIIVKDILRYTAGQLPLAGQAMRAEADVSGEGGASWAARQLDIESPTSLAAAKKERLIQKLRRKAMRHDIKRSEDLL